MLIQKSISCKGSHTLLSIIVRWLIDSGKYSVCHTNIAGVTVRDGD